MNRRIKKKVAKRQLIRAMQQLVDFCCEQQRLEEERRKQLAAAYERYFQKRAEMQRQRKEF